MRYLALTIALSVLSPAISSPLNKDDVGQLFTPSSIRNLLKSETPLATPGDVVLPVELFMFDGATMTNDIDRQFGAAAGIWAKAGITLKRASSRQLSKAESDKLLAKGTPGKLDTYLGCSQRFDEPGFSEREQLVKLKSRANALGVFVVTTVTQSQAEREFTQLYLDNDPTPSVIGRTLAHEIGHILLGEGHTGGERRVGPCDSFAAASGVQRKEKAPWTSGLMLNDSSATDISTEDAAVARRTASILAK